MTNIPRIWLRKSTSHSYKLPGVLFVIQLQEEINAISIMREKEDHGVLQALETLLTESIDECITLSEDILQAEVWIKDLTDILLGKADKKRNRNTELYKQKMTGRKIKNNFSNYIFSLAKKQNKYSPFLQEVIQHFRTTYNNWKKYLFICYDYCFLPNTNLELELSHSRMKRVHRRMTGKKHSQRFLLLHGEQMAFCFDWDFSADFLQFILQSVDYGKVQSKSRAEKMKSKKRGKEQKIIKNIAGELQKMVYEWNN